MFKSEDLEVFKKTASWEKNDELGTTFFPKLVALKQKSEELIELIYGINVNKKYKSYLAPTPSCQRRKNLSFNVARNSDNHVSVGFRAKGKPNNLYRPNGQLCKMHFACLNFEVFHRVNQDLAEGDNYWPEYALSVSFEPYILRYGISCRESLSQAVQAYEIDQLILNYAKKIYFSHDCQLLELIKKDRIWIEVNHVNVNTISNQDMAELVIACIFCFPILDIFTRLSNGEKLLDAENGRTLFEDSLNYKERFLAWYKNCADDYKDSFEIEPISRQGFWQAEALTRSMFEELLRSKFPKKRPTWLRTKNSKANMELDGYCEALKLAFEYNGEHHYMNIFENQLPFQRIQDNDRRKSEICKDNGVDLISVPYFHKGSYSFIVDQLRQLGREDIDVIMDINIRP